jgi:hypothetical protein
VQEKNLKTISGSSYVLDLSTHINSSQVQTGATVSLRISGLLLKKKLFYEPLAFFQKKTIRRKRFRDMGIFNYN